MNILQILPELNVGGVETGTVDFAKYLVTHGHRSVVVSNGGTLVLDLEHAGSTHYQLAVDKKSLWSMLCLIKPLRAIIRKEKIDIVHARSRVPAWIAYFACKKTKASFITTCHGYYKNRFFSQIMGWTKLIIVPSHVIGRHMIDHFGSSQQSIRCIPRSVDLEKFLPHKARTSIPVITIIGRLTQLKGHSYFLKAMSKVSHVMPKIKIWIIGDAPAKKPEYRHELETLVRRLGLKGCVEFLGNRHDIPEILSKTNVLVMSSVYPESFGRVILEAQAAGVPVVATKVGGVVDIIDHDKTGFLVMPKDTQAMANAVLKLLKDKDLVQRIIAEAHVKLKNEFTLEHMASRTLKVYEELQNSLNILVIKISSIGDVILVIPSLKVIREKFPNAKICCLIGKESRKILSACPYIDEVIVYDHKNADRGWWKVLALSRQLRKYRFDKVIDFQNNRKSHALAFLSMTRESYGYQNGKWGFLLTHGLKQSRWDISPVEHQFQVLKQLGILYKQANAVLELWSSSRDRQYVKGILDAHWVGSDQSIVGINIAASAKWQSKNWPIKYFARLCDMLARRNIRVVITGMDKDQPLVVELLRLTKAKPVVCVGKTDIMQLTVLIQRCQVFITPDSSPMHLAAAMKTPCIAFFGPTDSRRHCPPAKQLIVYERKLDCAPCYRPQCHMLKHQCMKDITPEEVFAKVKEILEVKT